MGGSLYLIKMLLCFLFFINAVPDASAVSPYKAFRSTPATYSMHTQAHTGHATQMTP